MISRKINLLIITDTYIGVPGGSERHLLNFLMFLDYTKFNVIAIQMCPNKLEISNLDLLAPFKGLRLLHRPLTSVKKMSFVSLLLDVRKLVKGNDIDLVVSYHEKSDLLNYCLSLFVSKNVKHVTSKRDLGFKLDGLLKRIMKFVTPRLDYITTPSNSIKNMLISDYKVRKNKVHVIANGVNLDLYSASTTKEKTFFDRKLGISQDSFVGVCVGSLKPVKGHDFLLRSFSIFRESSTHDWHLIIIGTGHLQDELLKLSLELKLDNVHFVGLQTNVEVWLKNSDLLISSSSSEGLSNSIIEGIASGLPVVATRVGGSPELVKAHKNGILVEFGNMNQFIEAFNFFDTHPEKLLEYGNNSRKFAEKEFANRLMVDRMQILYENIVMETGDK